MSEYTVELREYLEQFAGDSTKHAEIIENGRSKLFDFTYPIFDENYKKVFETHFIRKFYLREIGFETVGLFKFQLETWLLINMPYFNKIFESELLKYDPLTNSKMETTSNKKNDKTQNNDVTNTTKGNTWGTSDSTNDQTTDTTSNNTKIEDATLTEDNFNRGLESNTPDGRLSITPNADGTGVIEYANNIKENKDNNSKTENSSGTSETTGNVTDHATGKQTSSVDSNETQTAKAESTINDVEDYVEYRTGKIGIQSYGKLVKDYRESLLRVENTIFNEMNQLFMLVY